MLHSGGSTGTGNGMVIQSAGGFFFEQSGIETSLSNM